MVAYPNWTGNEPCRSMPPELYYPEGSSGTLPRIVLDMCQFCYTFDECLEWALHHEQDGIWASTTRNQRKQMRRARGITLSTPDHTTWIPSAGRKMKEAS